MINRLKNSFLTRNCKLNTKGEVIKAQESELKQVDAVELNQEWRVKFHASEWPARSTRPIKFSPGERVRIVAIENITLVIEPD